MPQADGQAAPARSSLDPGALPMWHERACCGNVDAPRGTHVSTSTLGLSGGPPWEGRRLSRQAWLGRQPGPGRGGNEPVTASAPAWHIAGYCAPCRKERPSAKIAGLPGRSQMATGRQFSVLRSMPGHGRTSWPHIMGEQSRAGALSRTRPTIARAEQRPLPGGGHQIRQVPGGHRGVQR